MIVPKLNYNIEVLREFWEEKTRQIIGAENLSQKLIENLLSILENFKQKTIEIRN